VAAPPVVDAHGNADETEERFCGRDCGEGLLDALAALLTGVRQTGNATVVCAGRTAYPVKEVYYNSREACDGYLHPWKRRVPVSDHRIATFRAGQTHQGNGRYS